MNKESFLWIEAELKQKDRLLLKCFKMKIPVFDTYEKEKSLFLKIKIEDYKKIKKFWFVKIKKGEVTGLLKVKELMWNYHIFLIAVVLGLCLLFFLTHVMVKVEVIHSKKEIREIVLLSLEERGIKKNTLRKSFQEIEKIKKEILDEYPEKLEWMEIETQGMNYIVRVEERKLASQEEEKSACHIVAMKDAIVKDMVFSKGDKVVMINDSVKKGDILISGIIKKDEEVKGVVCASGTIYGEVWYQVSASVPLEYEITKRTGKTRWNFRYRNSYYDDFLLKSRLENYEEEKKPFFHLFGQEISFVIQHEVEKEKKKYTEEEATNLAIEKALEKIESTLGEKERIIDKKVLKKEQNNSTMNVEIFVSVKESIGEVQEFNKEELEKE